MASFIICSVLIAIKVNAQDADQKMLVKIIDLQNSGVDTIVSYHPHCTGGAPVLITPGDTAKCHPTRIWYVVWQSGGSNYIQRFDECYRYQPVIDKSQSILNLIKYHLSEIKNEEIKPVAYRVTIKGRSQLLQVVRDHSCHGDLVFYISGKIIPKQIDDFELDTQFIDDNQFRNGRDTKVRRTNIYYNYNQSTCLKQVKDLFEKEVSAPSLKNTIQPCPSSTLPKTPVPYHNSRP